MKSSLLLLLAAAVAGPAHAQNSGPSLDPVKVERRVGALESQMRAVQRKVFPGGDPKLFAPDITPSAAPAPEPVGVPATSQISDLSQRVDALEQQLRTLTGQVETLQFKQRQLDEGQAKLRGDIEFRLTQLEAGKGPAAATPPADALPVTEAPRLAKGAKAALEAKPKPDARPEPKAATADAAWKSAYAKVLNKDWATAAPAMTAFLADWPNSPRLAQAQYWLGRAQLEQKNNAEAARAFLDGYTNYRQSPRAADSLLGLAKALQGLKKPKDSCRVLGQLNDEYGEKLSKPQQADAKALAEKSRCEG